MEVVDGWRVVVSFSEPAAAMEFCKHPAGSIIAGQLFGHLRRHPWEEGGTDEKIPGVFVAACKELGREVCEHVVGIPCDVTFACNGNSFARPLKKQNHAGGPSLGPRLDRLDGGSSRSRSVESRKPGCFFRCEQ